ncbi:MAG TPA: hypothetical protein PK892_09065 [Bacteroidales bacterium]|nr:hypothetical protein [Bacteroidales bacterium]
MSLLRIHRCLLALLVVTIFIASCKKSEEDPANQPYGRITFRFDQMIDGKPVVKNQLLYTNAAGNQYLVTDVMYFISDITLYRNDSGSRMIKDWQDIFYIDDAIPSTLVHPFLDKIEPGIYDSISFIFGITEEKNKSFMFVNPPEVNMAWPSVLGGGYHYMMINGKWMDTTGLLMPFNLHLGIGQLYHGTGYNTDSIYAFVQNFFKVSLHGSSFTLNDRDSLVFRLAMNIERWFEGPHLFDFNQWGGDIMQKQPAMQVVKENGADVFTIQPVTRLPAKY